MPQQVSVPVQGGAGPGGIPTKYLLIGGGVLAAAAIVLLTRKGGASSDDTVGAPTADINAALGDIGYEVTNQTGQLGLQLRKMDDDNQSVFAGIGTQLGHLNDQGTAITNAIGGVSSQVGSLSSQQTQMWGQLAAGQQQQWNQNASYFDSLAARIYQLWMQQAGGTRYALQSSISADPYGST